MVRGVVRSVDSACGLGSVSIALDAAHIHWSMHGGPDGACNGPALCVHHHQTLELRAFTGKDGKLLVSEQANGRAGFQETLLDCDGKPIRELQNPVCEPAHAHWGRNW